ncbi:hypothetical protein GLYMA_07G042350v4 [Glycine max]|nr:hypothetical protein GLYMA_07G042350v4 [Glycine max]KAH1085339.1 hypothetical protein GYH30_017365 [Glycine max]
MFSRTFIIFNCFSLFSLLQHLGYDVLTSSVNIVSGFSTCMMRLELPTYRLR